MQRHHRWRFLALGLSLALASLAATSCSSSAAVDVAEPTLGATSGDSAGVASLVDPSETDDASTSSGAEQVAGASRGAGRESTAPDQPYASIRDVDFRNGFTYDVGLEPETESASVVDGAYLNGDWGDSDFFGFYVTDVEFGDFDRDGVDDAAVTTSWNTGGSGFFDTVRAFRLVEGTVEPAGIVRFGDRAHGGIHRLHVDNGQITVWSFSTTLGACCANQITEHRLALGEHWLTEADHSITRRWLALDPSQDPAEVSFMPNTSSAVVTVYQTESEGSFFVEASQGQVLTIDLAYGPAPADISVLDTSTGQIMSGLADMVLPSDAIYEVSVLFDRDRVDPTALEIIVDGGEPEPAVRWTPAVEQMVLDQDPFVRSGLVWPVFESNQPGVERANSALGAFVHSLDDLWVEDVTNSTEPLDDSSYEVSYKVTAVSEDIVAVRFDFYDYVCCRPYPNYGHRAAVLDLAAGEIIPVDQIVDVNRIGDLNRLWFAELDAQDLLPTDVIVEGEDVVRFDSLTLVPGGIELGTDRNSLGGGMPGTQVVLTFDQLGDLINPSIVDRMSTS